MALLPVEVEPLSINAATSRVITPQVIDAYKLAAGDFLEAVCDLPSARRKFSSRRAASASVLPSAREGGVLVGCEPQPR